mmetsp:Transcript_3564/g.2591  ORF Transcript_3564/g.2591 Transcript_3564/m.2591 type:complete len:164 (+) Transcript_3564:170-661(+)
MIAKNLFLHNKKNKEQLFLVIAAHNTTVDMKELTKHLKVGSGNLRGADEDVMKEVLGTAKGHVCVFALMNDTAKKVKVLLDKRLLEEFPYIAFHPMQNDATVCMVPSDMTKIIDLSGHVAEVLDFSSLMGKPAEEEKKAGAGEEVVEIGVKAKKEDNFSSWYS